MSDENRKREYRQWILGLLEEFETRLTQYAMRLTRGDREAAVDAVQHTFMKLCDQSKPAIEDRMPGWLFRVCRNKVIDDMRKHSREETATELLVDPLASREVSPQDSVERSDLTQCLHRLIDCLPSSQREAIHLWSQGLDYNEISRITSKSNGAVRVLVHRALTHLRGHPRVKEWLAEEVTDAAPHDFPPRTLERASHKK